jgi:hypothetical protein
VADETPFPFPTRKYLEAVETELADRSIAFLGLPDKICGIPCFQLNAEKYETLRLDRSPFILGGTIDYLDVAKFLWIVSKCFSHDGKEKNAFFEAIYHLDLDECIADINEYMDRAFLDCPQSGKKDRPLASLSANIYYQMSGEPYRWTLEQTMKAPLAMIFQLIKVKHIAEKGTGLINRRSDKIRGDYYAELNARNLAKKQNG